MHGKSILAFIFKPVIAFLIVLFEVQVEREQVLSENEKVTPSVI